MLMLEGDFEDKFISSTRPLHSSTPVNVASPDIIDSAAAGNSTNLTLCKSVTSYKWNIFIKREINARTQGSNERVYLFISVMNGLFNQLNVKPYEATIIDRICRIWLPFYLSHLALYHPATISELTARCGKFEERKLGSKI